jgi:GntR family transcriptional repressor for pyruvate dehydrogenase complex
MPIGKIERKKSYILIVDQLKELISRGEIGIGEKLPPERILAEKFGVARPTVREALSALEILGIIDVQVGSGAYVTGIPQAESPQLLNQLQEEPPPPDLFEVRKAIESLSAAKAAENASEEDIERIRNLVLSMEQDLKEDTFSLEKDRQFHLSLAEASQNAHLVEIVRYIVSAMRKPLWQKYIMKNISIEGHKAMYVNNHRKILEAIEARKPEQAKALMTEHLQGGIVLDDWD